jgi:hypothetical protein
MDYRFLLQEALPVVEEAAAFIRSQAGKVKDEDVEIKARNSLVSYVDKGPRKSCERFCNPYYQMQALSPKKKLLPRRNLNTRGS